MRDDARWMGRWWDLRSYWYLKLVGDTYVGPFKTMTRAFLHRKFYGPEKAEIVYCNPAMFGELFPPMSPEEHRYKRAVED